MLGYGLYRFSTEAYMLVVALVSPVLCIVGWLLLGRAAGKRLRSYVHWLLPLVIGSSFSTLGVLLQTFVALFARRDYALVTAAYMLALVSVPFHIAWFVRLWKTITNLPPSPGEQPQTSDAAPDESVWPPPPQR